MKRISLIPGLLTLSVTALLLAACAGADAPSPTPAATTPAPTAAPASVTAEPGVASGPVAEGKALRSIDGGLEVRSASKSSIDVTLRAMKAAPEPPAGWALVSPVYDITARDRDRVVTRLTSTVDLRFATSQPASVIYFDGKGWVLVESETDGATLVASVDHFTPYAAAKPAKGGSSAPLVTPTPKPSLTPPDASAPSPASSRTPEVNATATVSASDAKSALEAAASKYKGKQVRVSNAAGYTGTGNVALPPPLEQLLNAAAALSGALYHGLYNGVNEAFTTSAASSTATGSLTVLVEAKTTFPASAADASAQLATLFPGAIGPKYGTVTSTATGYTFLGSKEGVTFVLGYVLYQGLPLAYMTAGGGSYETIAQLPV